MCLGRYNGITDVEDNVIARLEALRNVLARCTKGKQKAGKLIVESDNVILIQYVNGHPEPNEIMDCRLKEIFNFLEGITSSIYHVHEEVNKAARDLLLRDNLV